MKNVKTLTVTVSYTVELEDTTMPQVVFDQLKEVAEESGEISDSDLEQGEAHRWLAATMEESYSSYWAYTIDEIS